MTSGGFVSQIELFDTNAFGHDLLRTTSLFRFAFSEQANSIGLWILESDLPAMRRRC